MAIKQLNPYLLFNGAAGKALELYQSALGAKVQSVTRYGDMPHNQQPPENKDRVMHAALSIGAGVLMLSDVPPGESLAPGRAFQVCLDFDDPADLQTKFDALAHGGSVDAPVSDTFWSAKFGMLTDAFGVRWMFNCELKKA
ncbi:MAG: VOC family protein [Pseudomonadota bacterium]